MNPSSLNSLLRMKGRKADNLLLAFLSLLNFRAVLSPEGRI